MSELFNKIYDYDTLAAAWVRIQQNGGCRGSDGMSIKRFQNHLEKNLRELAFSLKMQTYHPYPLMRLEIPKRSAGGIRYLSIPTVRDRVAQTAVFLVTKDIFYKEFEVVSHAYQEGKGVATAIAAIKKWRDKGYKFVVDADIESFFDNVSHAKLMTKLRKLFSEPEIIRLFEKWIRAEVYDGQRIFTLTKGIPQGSVVSPHMANLHLDEFDETLIEFGMKLVRYADDFLILCKTLPEAEEAIELTDMILDDLNLELNPLKTKIVSFDEGFKFLGAIFMSKGIYLPYGQKKKRDFAPILPKPLNLRKYLECKNWVQGK